MEDSMKKELGKMGMVHFLESLVFKRFNNIDELKNFLQKRVKDTYKVTLIEKSIDEINDDSFTDWEFIGTFENDNLLCDFDIYYAKTRDGGFIITEVGYEFE